MKKLIFVLSSVLLVTAHVSCKNPNTDSVEDEVVETVVVESTSEETEEVPVTPPVYVPSWVAVITNEDAIDVTDKCAGIDYIVINDRAENVLSDLINDGKIKLEFIEKKTLKTDATVWYGNEECIGDTISLYKVYVDTKKVSDIIKFEGSIKLTDISFSICSYTGKITYYRYVIENINNEWKMKVYSGYSYKGGSLGNEIVSKKYIKKFYN